MADPEAQKTHSNIVNFRHSIESQATRTNEHDVNSSTGTLNEKKAPTTTQSDADGAPIAKLPTNGYHNIPNGGLQAWLQVAGCFSVFFNTWGLLNTFGVFQTYYESGQLFVETSSNISWIGSIQAYCVLLGGLFSGPVYDRGYLRVLLLLGSFMIIFGHMMLSISHTFWEALLAQGFCIGLGAGMLFVPALAVLPTYFNTRIGLAVGLAASGSSFGGIIYPIVFYRLVNQIGFGWSVRVLGFICLATLLVAIFFLKMRIKPAKARALIDWAAFKDWQYMTFVVGTMIGFIALYVLLFYLSYYGQASGTTDASLSFYLVPILNAASMFGRTVPNAISDKTGPINLLIPGCFICAGLVFAMIGVHSVGAIIVLTLLFGFFSGVFIALPPVCFVALTPDKSKIGTRIGMGFAMIGFGSLIGGPGGGAILSQTGNGQNWTGLWVFGGVTGMVAGVILLGLRLGKTGFKLAVKV